MQTTVKFEGGKELERNLYELSQRLAKKVARAAVRKAAKPILDAARSNVPVREGRLKRALRLRVDTLRNNRSVMSAAIDVKFSGDYRPRISKRWSTVKGKFGPPRYDYQIGSAPKVYGAFVEFGTSDTAPQPFLRPAWDSQGGDTALEVMIRELRTGIERETAAISGL